MRAFITRCITWLPVAFIIVVTAGMTLANWNVARQTAYAGRHRATKTAPPPPVVRLADPLVSHIDLLAAPVHSCALPPAPGARAYLELPSATARLTAARNHMRRRARLLKAARWPSGELVILPADLSPFGTPLEPDEWWTPVRELVGAAS